MTVAAAFIFVLLQMPGVENSVGSLASGTSIEPLTASESSSMVHVTWGNWTAMFHGNAFLTGIQQNGPRGRDKLFAPNWAMVAVNRQFGRQAITFRTMLSLEPATITKRKYPLLFQTGETAFGSSIVDGQHPHDFFMELAARYELALNERSQLFVYAAPVGEAALGPTAFPHRSSASENPLATLGHHQQDSTHIATNVITLGVAAGRVQMEASTFHGQEPNENRWTPDTGKPDSFAARLTVAPTRNLSAQVSTGRLNRPEAGDPLLDVIRTTASAHLDAPLASGRFASSVIWGRNKDVKPGKRRIFNSYAFETTVNFRKRNWVWGRIENVDRDRTLLPPPVASPPPPLCVICGIIGFGVKETPFEFPHVVEGPDGVPVTIEEDPIGRVQAFTLGYERELPGPSWLNVGLGAQITTYQLPQQLQSIYGERPSTVAFFLRVRPSGNMAGHMKAMHTH